MDTGYHIRHWGWPSNGLQWWAFIFLPLPLREIGSVDCTMGRTQCRAVIWCAGISMVGGRGGGAVRGASFSSSWMNLMCFQAGIRSVPLLMSKVSQVLPKNFLQQSYFICYWFSPNECMRCLCDEGSCHCQKLRGNPLHSAEWELLWLGIPGLRKHPFVVSLPLKKEGSLR